MNPVDKKRLPGTYEDWLSQAESDLNFARLGQEQGGVFVELFCL